MFIWPYPQVNGQTVAGFSADRTCRLIKSSLAEVSLMVRDRPFTRTYLLEKGLDNTVGLHLVGNKVVKIERGSSAERWVECVCVCVCVHACVCVCVCVCVVCVVSCVWTCSCAYSTACTSLVCLHTVQLTCVLDMCSTFTKRARSSSSWGDSPMSFFT